MPCRQVAVQWTTSAQAAGAEVQYGISAGRYTGTAPATFYTYTRTDMCGGEAATTGYIFPGVHVLMYKCPLRLKTFLPYIRTT